MFSRTRDKIVAAIVTVACICAGLMGTAIATAEADVGTNYFMPRSVEPWYGLFGSAFGCVVHRPSGKVEVRVTTRAAERTARRLIANRKKLRGARLSYVRRVDRSQSLVNFLAAWQFASQSLSSQPVIASSGAAEWISSPTVPLSRDRCRTVVVSVYSYPGHEATADELAWANSVAAKYPAIISVDARTVENAPVIPQ